MSYFNISEIYPANERAQKKVSRLLDSEGIRRDTHLDYTCGMYDDDMNLIATGSCFGNTLRCMAVDQAHQGEGLMNEIVTHLIQVQYKKGISHIFLYTKCSTAHFFKDLGFHEIIRVDDEVVFMENKRTGFKDYLNKLAADKKEGLKTAALVMNANPFTLGHQYLVEQASKENDLLHLFIVSEEESLIPFNIRKKLVLEGCAHLSNICFHDSGPYIISNATFPSYFQKDEDAVIKSHADLDLLIFTEIAKVLDIKKRYVGEEPNSRTTSIYNGIMAKSLPEHGIECVILPRKDYNHQAISASTVRQALKDGHYDILEHLVPKTTLQYLLSDEAKPVIDRIRNEMNVIHD